MGKPERSSFALCVAEGSVDDRLPQTAEQHDLRVPGDDQAGGLPFIEAARLAVEKDAIAGHAQIQRRAAGEQLAQLADHQITAAAPVDVDDQLAVALAFVEHQ